MMKSLDALNTKMKRILILSYFYPPSNFVGGHRVEYWAKNLTKYGIYPTIVTRNWNQNQSELTDEIKDNDLKHEVFESHEVYYLPYKRSLRDKLHHYSNDFISVFLRKTLSFMELLTQNLPFALQSYSVFFEESNKILKSKKYDLIIASGRPFKMFHVAHKLYLANDVEWIADYRDEWSTFQNKKNKSALLHLVGYLESRSEKSWTKSCKYFLTVSENWMQNISAFINKQGFVVKNGFDKSPKKVAETRKVTHADKPNLAISYVGSLYAEQPIEILIDNMTSLISKYKERISIKLIFVGTEIMPDQLERVKQLSRGFESNFSFISKIPKKQVDEIYKESDYLLVTCFRGVKGWLPVKLFDYAVSGRPILLIPSDNGVMENFVLETNTGIAVNQNGAYQLLDSLITNKIMGKEHVFNVNVENLNYHSRENQTKILSNIINNR